MVRHDQRDAAQPRFLRDVHDQADRRRHADERRPAGAGAPDSREDIDRIIEAAIAAGRREAHAPEDIGFMYSRAFWDLDGHGSRPMWMDVAAAVAAQDLHQSIVG